MTHDERMEKLEELSWTLKCAQGFANRHDSFPLLAHYEITGTNRLKDRVQTLMNELFPEEKPA